MGGSPVISGLRVVVGGGVLMNLPLKGDGQGEDRGSVWAGVLMTSAGQGLLNEIPGHPDRKVSLKDLGSHSHTVRQ